MFQRSHYQILQRRVHAESRQFIQVIYGPRQVGKTTLVQQLLATTTFPSHYASADAIPTGQGAWISQQWELALSPSAGLVEKPCLFPAPCLSFKKNTDHASTRLFRSFSTNGSIVSTRHH